MKRREKWCIWEVRQGAWFLVREASVRLGRTLRGATRHSKTTQNRVLVGFATVKDGAETLDTSRATYPPSAHCLTFRVGAHHAGQSLAGAL